MKKICGYDILDNKKIFVALQKIRGIGKTTSLKILKQCNVNPDIKVLDLEDKDLLAIEKIVSRLVIGEQLSNLIRSKIDYKKRLMNYEGLRHIMGLPLKGRTKTNAKTRKIHKR